MVDRNLERFYGRIGRIEKIHHEGGGFEADGTLGMSYYNSLKQPRVRRRGFLAPLVLVLMTVVVIKSVVHATIGAQVYDDRITTLRDGPYVDRVGAYILQADPVTQMLSSQIKRVFF